MKNKRFYVIVSIDVQSDNEITEEVIQNIYSEMDYNFEFRENNTTIVDTEIQHVSIVPFL